jgi:ribose 5-phosphate isomerase RpiB
MKIAIVTEFSTSAKNQDVAKALAGREHEVVNYGMLNPDDKPSLNYLHTGFLTGVLLNTGAADIVVGGCGTGVGYATCAMMFPNVYCTIVEEPLDAWLYIRINAGNCISLPLNKGYGWASDVKLRQIMDEFLGEGMGAGYPPERSDIQAELREKLKGISRTTHRSMIDIVKDMDAEFVREALSAHNVKAALEKAAAEGAPEQAALAQALLAI